MFWSANEKPNYFLFFDFSCCATFFLFVDFILLRDLTDFTRFADLVVRELDFAGIVKFKEENAAFTKKHLMLGDTRFVSESGSETRCLPVPLPKNSGSPTNVYVAPLLDS